MIRITTIIISLFFISCGEDDSGAANIVEFYEKGGSQNNYYHIKKYDQNEENGHCTSYRELTYMGEVNGIIHRDSGDPSVSINKNQLSNLRKELSSLIISPNPNPGVKLQISIWSEDGTTRTDGFLADKENEKFITNIKQLCQTNWPIPE